MTFLLKKHRSPSNSVCPLRALIQEPLGSIPVLRGDKFVHLL